MSLPVTVILPSLNPDEKLLAVVEGIIKVGFGRMILVDDGSSAEHQKYFQQALALAEEKGLSVDFLRHAKNLGKGRGLKNAFNYYLCHPGDSVGVVTVDGDNQHRAEDILRCAQALVASPDRVYLGCRDFSLPHVPPKSRVGNRITSFLFLAACGIRLSDTQTGLRAIPNCFLSQMLDLQGERFEYETNMLLEMKQQGIPFAEIPIETVYLEENRSSHYRPLVDSLRILRILMRFMLASGSSLVLDLGAFALLSYLLRGQSLATSVVLSTVLARIISSMYNLSINKLIVFKNQQRFAGVAVRYYLLCGIQMLCSAVLVSIFTGLVGRVWSVPVKLAVDTVLFFASFQIQREWVFSNQR